MLTHIKNDNDLSNDTLIEERDRYDNTPLHIASKKGFKKVVKLLLKFGAVPDPCNDEELTPLHLAALNGHTKYAHFHQFFCVNHTVLVLSYTLYVAVKKLCNADFGFYHTPPPM